MRKIKLTEQKICPFGEIVFNEAKKCLEFEWECWFDVDAYFGTNTNGDYDTWVSLYTEWYPDGTLTGRVVISSPLKEESKEWGFTDEEKKFLFRELTEYVKDIENFDSLEEMYEHCAEEYGAKLPFRYSINGGDFGGVVLAATKNGAEKKVRALYEDDDKVASTILVWDFTADDYYRPEHPDVIECYGI